MPARRGALRGVLRRSSGVGSPRPCVRDNMTLDLHTESSLENVQIGSSEPITCTPPMIWTVDTPCSNDSIIYVGQRGMAAAIVNATRTGSHLGEGPSALTAGRWNSCSTSLASVRRRTRSLR